MDDNKSAVLICTCGKQLQLGFDFLSTQVQKMDLASSVTVHDLVCQDEGLEKIAELLKSSDEHLVIAACSSQKIQPRIDQYLETKGISSSQIQYVNLREHSAWVHNDVDEASKKTLDMIRGTLARSAKSTKRSKEQKEVLTHVTVIGGGIAGIESALSLSNLGYDVSLLEITDELGGHVKSLPIVAPTGKSGKEILSSRLNAIKTDDKISIMTKTQIRYVTGEMGNFSIHYSVEGDEEERTMKTSAIVLATGFKEFKPIGMNEYHYGKNPDVITQFELSSMLTEGELVRPSDGKPVKEVVMVQCVGSRSEDYKKDCSKLCCTFAIDNSLEILERAPDANVRIVYMDIRVPFENEMIYKESREKGVDYIRGRVSMTWEQDGSTHVRVYDSLLDKYLETEVDLLVLSSAVLPPDGTFELSETAGYAIEDNGHVKELYGKLRRNETRRRGIVAVGGVTRPQFVFEAVTDAQAGALVIHNELQGGKIESISRGAVLNVDDCVGCSLCAQQCPRGVPLMIEQTEEEDDEEQKILFKATIDTMNCHSCGVCQSLCPSGATQLNFLSNDQLWSEIEATLEGTGSEYPITLCFYCEECSVSTIDIVGTRKMEYPASIRLIPVPCAGRVSIIDILKALEQGASTVMIAACETDRCHIGGTGNEIAQVQVDVAQDILNAIGWKGERVDMFRMFSAEPDRFINAANEMVKRAKKLGPTPVHEGTAGKWMEVAK
ncbi:MAG: hydrogenase iron-sulfur subunit [Candidatus Thorarchaeota archaeon]